MDASGPIFRDRGECVGCTHSGLLESVNIFAEAIQGFKLTDKRPPEETSVLCSPLQYSPSLTWTWFGGIILLPAPPPILPTFPVPAVTCLLSESIMSCFKCLCSRFHMREVFVVL